MSTTRRQRTPDEIIADAQAQIAAQRLKQAKQDAQNHPALAPKFKEMDALRNDIRDARKILGEGPQSANTRRAKHEAWIAKIDAEEADALATLESAEAAKAQLQAEIEAAVAEFASESAES